MQDRVHGPWPVEFLSHIVSNKAKPRMACEVGDIVRGSREKIVNAKDPVASFDHAVRKMGPQKPGPAGDDDESVFLFKQRM